METSSKRRFFFSEEHQLIDLRELLSIYPLSLVSPPLLPAFYQNARLICLLTSALLLKLRVCLKRLVGAIDLLKGNQKERKEKKRMEEASFRQRDRETRNKLRAFQSL